MKSWYFRARDTDVRRCRWGQCMLWSSLLRDNAETLDDNDNDNNTSPSVLSTAMLYLPVLILRN